MDIEQSRKASYQAIDRICGYYYDLQNKPVKSAVEPGYLRPLLPAAAPEEGEDFQLIADDYQKYIVPGLTHWQHPSFFAYFPTTCSFEGILGDLYATSAPQLGFNWSCNPTATELEAIVMDWSAQLFGLAPAFLNASGTHSLGLKAGLVLGLVVRALEVTAADRYALRGDTLRRALEDAQSGKMPFMLMATVGSTSSGAVNDLSKSVIKDHPYIWLHVDAAWAGWGRVNFDASTLWVRDRKYLTDALDITPPFLRTAQGDAGTVDYRSWHLALGRKFRSLKVWFGIALNVAFVALVSSSDLLALVTPPALVLTVFRLAPPAHAHAAPAALNVLNTTLFAGLAARTDIALTQTVLNGVFCIRFAIGAAGTTEAHVRAAYDAIMQEAREALTLWEAEKGM
ncbi:pyridoxal phosphate-dependent transferase [Mycena sp. CBHHK59/15]|nr:pyridoxal phosphate-dependent transferase [Mycena sp. CBHHK59/15]